MAEIILKIVKLEEMNKPKGAGFEKKIKQLDPGSKVYWFIGLSRNGFCQEEKLSTRLSL